MRRQRRRNNDVEMLWAIFKPFLPRHWHQYGYTAMINSDSQAIIIISFQRAPPPVRRLLLPP